MKSKKIVSGLMICTTLLSVTVPIVSGADTFTRSNIERVQPTTIEGITPQHPELIGYNSNDKVMTGKGCPQQELPSKWFLISEIKLYAIHADGKSYLIGSTTVGTDGRWSISFPKGLQATKLQVEQITKAAYPWIGEEIVLYSPIYTAPTINALKEGDKSISGTTTPGTSVIIGRDKVPGSDDYIGDSVTSASDSGNWGWEYETPLRAGETILIYPQFFEPFTTTVLYKPSFTNQPKVEDTTLSGTGNIGEILEVWTNTQDTEHLKKLGTVTVDDTGHWKLDFTDFLIGGSYVQLKSSLFNWLDKVNVASKPAFSTPPKVGDTTLSGTGTAGESLEVWTNTQNAQNPKQLGTVTVDDTGHWKLNFTAPLTAGDYVQLKSSLFNWLDKVNVASKPVITPPYQEGDDTLSGKGTPGEFIEVYTGNPSETDSHLVAPSTTVDDSGNWHLFLTSPLVAGNYLQINSGIFGLGDKVNIDYRTAITSQIAHGSQSLSGTGKVGDTIEVWTNTQDANNPKHLGTVTVDSTGHWTLNFTDPLNGGDYVQLNSTALGWGDKVNVPPQYALPVITNKVRAGDKRISGTGTVGDLIEVWTNTQDANNPKQLGTATVDSTGHWKLEFTDSLIAGNYVQLNSTTSGWGDKITVSTDPNILSPVKEGVQSLSGTGLPGNHFEIWSYTLDANGDSSYSLRLASGVVKADGTWSVNLSEPLNGGNYVRFEGDDNHFGDMLFIAFKPVFSTPPKAGDSTLSGTASPGVAVEIWTKNADGTNETKVATAMADNNGHWTATLTEPLTDGQKLQIKTDDFGAGDEVTSISKPAITTQVKEGDSTISGTATPGATVEIWSKDPNGDNGNQLGTVTADSSGHWSYTFTDELTGGSQIQIKTDHFGWGDPMTIAYKPVITTQLKEGIKNLVGIATPGATVEIWSKKADGSPDKQLGTTTADNVTGEWSLTLTDSLMNGMIIQTKSSDFGWGDTTTVIGKPVFTTKPKEGDTTLSGTATPGSYIEIWTGKADGSDEKQLDTITVAADGQWTSSFTDALVGGNYIQIRANGNDSDKITVISKPVITNQPKQGQKDIDGTATPGATVEVWTKKADGTNDKQLGTVTADSTGRWILNLTDGLSGGVTVQVKSSDFGWGDTVSVIHKPVITSPLVDPFRTVSGTASPGAKITLWAYDKQQNSQGENGTTTADASGNWTLDPIENYGPGHFFQVESSDYGFGDMMVITGE